MGHIYLKECFVEKICHYDALRIWTKIGENRNEPLFLGLSGIEYTFDGEGFKPEKEDAVTSDAKTISVWFKCKQGNEAETVKQIGELSEDDSKLIVDFIRQGWETALSANISYIKDDADEGKRMKIVIYIEKRN